MICYDTEFMRLYEELSLINEASKNKNKPNKVDDTLEKVQKLLNSYNLVPISEVLDVEKSTSDTGWTFLIPANKISDFRKQTPGFDDLVRRELSNITDCMSINGWPHHAKGNILNNGKRPIVELDFGRYIQKIEWRGLGFSAPCKNHKYFILGYIFAKKRQKINADDLEVVATNKLYDAIKPTLDNLSKN